MPEPDVLVIGGSLAALCAAIAARRAGASVRLAELAPRSLRGGNARHGRNFRIMHPAPTPFSPGRYDGDEYLAELHRAAEGRNDPALSRELVVRSADIVSWLAAQGVGFQRADDGLLPVSRRTSFFLGGGKAMVNALYHTAERLGVAIGYDSGATELRITDGALRQVMLHTPAGTRMLRPRTTIVCCGGAQADLAGLRPFWGEAADAFIIRGVPYADGAVLRGLIAQGVATAGVPGACHLVAVDARSPPVDGGIVTRVLGIPAGIVVDRDARRFHDEGGDVGPTRYAVWGRKVAEQPGRIAWLILDAEGERQVPPLLFPPLRAATIPDLAALAGLDAAALAGTVAGFNAALRGEGDAGHTVGLAPAKTRHARPLLIPPFAAIPIRPGITFTCFGVKVDARARVLMTDDTPIPNLFAAGMIMAPNILGTGYLAGAAMAISAVFGRLAGDEAARHVRA
ncbi:FAD-dependent tricarballylate dehydrogenase TcuA [Rhodovastum atsumiense]|uniref:FAD-dependent tricarballylate dehydrogenase TcuA n=2 Tax=Rhodovastum atsumiense TaxID=504468 RepID=A0A5M6IX89_9PROT|nr:FAD-dependent tricarballylate dehydrogenase TcuA [Rhodovastum atsumiense]